MRIRSHHRLLVQNLITLSWMTSLNCGLAQESIASRWVISALHPDPTPALGAPDEEYIALFATGAAGAQLETDGLSVSWNGHQRSLPEGTWPAGTILVIHRDADSSEFTGSGLPRLGLSSWPALVNGGARVLLQDSLMHVLDAVLYDEESLSGGGRPLLRKDPQACGAMANFRAWSAGEGAYAPLFETMSPEGVAWTLQAMQEEASAFHRLLHRGNGQLEWRLPGPVSPRCLEEVRWEINGVVAADLEWASDSVITAFWPADLGDSAMVTLGPVEACASSDSTGHLDHTVVLVSAWGEVDVVGMLADPASDEKDGERVVLHNGSHVPLDAGAWMWDQARLRRRRILLPGQDAVFSETEFDHWPGLTNSGGSMALLHPSGSTLTSWSWSPCDHSDKSYEETGTPLVRHPIPGANWHSEGTDSRHPEPTILGFGCRRDWSGGVRDLEVHLTLPPSFLGPVQWTWQPDGGTTVPIEPEGVSEHPRTLRFLHPDGGNWPLDWPLSGRIEAWGVEGHHWSVGVTCPTAVPQHPVEIRVVEALWNAVDRGGEFVEIGNVGLEPVDLQGLEVMGEDPQWSPSWAWETWVPGDVSLVLPPEQVMAFGQCPRWFRSGHDGAGEACWPAEQWSALPDDRGELWIRLPSGGPHALDAIGWSDDMKGPWWWRSDGWSWTRVGRGKQDWTPSKDGGSPGRVDETPSPECGQGDPPFVVESVLGELPSIHWEFPGLGHGIMVRMVDWPGGTVKSTWVQDQVDMKGGWTWDGRDAQGLPMPPGNLIWDIRWWGRTCRGRKRERIRVPGHR